MFASLKTLRFRLAWTQGLFVFALLLGMGAARQQVLSWRSLRGLDRHLEWDAEFALGRIRLTADGFAWNRDGLALEERMRRESLRQLCVIATAAGEVLSREDHSPLAMAFVDSGRLDSVLQSRGGFTNASLADGNGFRFITVPVPRGGPGGSALLHLGAPLENVSAVMQEFASFFAFSLPLIFLVSGGIAWFFAGRALKPFELVAQSVESVTLHHLQRISTGRNEREIRRLEDAFNAMVSRLNDSVSQMRRFNTNAAHELRTPLAILQGETELALRSPGLPEGTRALLSSNLEELGRLSRIVNDLLSLADVDGGAQILAHSPVPLKPMLAELADQMSTLAAEQNVRLRVGNVPEVTVDGDELWLRRAFLNLLDNAIKYSKGEGEVVVSASVEGANVRVSVTDNGIGIAPGDMPYIFERLYRADPARNRAGGGAGLGLAIVKWVVEAHGGAVTVDSSVGRGSTFVVTLPTMIPRAS